MENQINDKNLHNTNLLPTGNNVNVKVVLVAVISTALITSIIVGIVTTSLTLNKTNPLSNFLGVETNNVGQDELSKNFDGTKKNEVYTESELGGFYSAYFDVMFYYPKKRNLFFYETGEGVIVSLNTSSSENESALITINDSRKIENYIQIYTNLKGKDLQDKVKSRNELIANAYRIDFDYSDAIKAKLLPDYHYTNKVVLVRKLTNEKDMVIEYNGKNIDKYIEDLLYLINSFKFNPENVERIIRFDFGNDNFYVNMNRILWIYQASDQSRLFLRFFFNQNFEKDQFNVNGQQSTLNMEYTIINTATPDAMAKQADKDLNYYKNQLFKNANVLSPVTKKTIAGKNAYDFTLSYKNENGQINEVYYALIDSGHGFFVTVRFIYPSKDSNAYLEFKKVLENLKFN